MNNNIVTANHYLEEEGLIYLDDIKQVGIHIRGLARLLDCDPKTVQNLFEGLGDNQVLEATLQTATGEKTVKFVPEKAVIAVLKSAALSTKIKPETKQNALDLFERFALAGFKLIAMMKIAPEKLGIAPTSAPIKPKSLLDLTQNQLFKLGSYRDARSKGFVPDEEILEGIDSDLVGAPANAVWFAYQRKVLENEAEQQRTFALLEKVHGLSEQEEGERKGSMADSLENWAAMEADNTYRIPFESFESGLKAIANRSSTKLPLSEG
jgi:hypothetical protein